MLVMITIVTNLNRLKQIVKNYKQKTRLKYSHPISMRNYTDMCVPPTERFVWKVKAKSELLLRTFILFRPV